MEASKKAILEFQTESGDKFLVEIDENEVDNSLLENTGGEVEKVATNESKITKKLKKIVNNAFGVITTVGNQVINATKKMEEVPQNIEVKMNLKVSGGADFYIAKTDAEASMEVVLKWNKEKK